MRRWLPALAFLLASSACTAENALPGDANRFSATAMGRVDSADEARQLVAALDGVITGVHVRRGEAVHRGQLLLTVDCRIRVGTAAAMDAQVGAAQARARLVAEGARAEDRSRGQANLAAAEAALHDALDRLARAEELLPRGFVTDREVTALRNVVRQARGEFAARDAEVRALHNGARTDEIREAAAASAAAAATARAALAARDQCALRSPIDGQVLQILRQQGEFSGASQGQPLVIVGDLDRLIVRAEINERDVASIRLGQRVEIWTDWDKQHWRGRVIEAAGVMGRRSARSLNPSDRFDRDIREAFIAIDGSAPLALVGLRVTVGFLR